MWRLIQMAGVLCGLLRVQTATTNNSHDCDTGCSTIRPGGYLDGDRLPCGGFGLRVVHGQRRPGGVGTRQYERDRPRTTLTLPGGPHS